MQTVNREIAQEIKSHIESDRKSSQVAKETIIKNYKKEAFEDIKTPKGLEKS